MDFWENAERQAALNVYLYTVKDTPKRGEQTAGVRLIDFVLEEGGLCAAVWEDDKGNISVVFRGTGQNEWVDNGVALSGTRGKNIYYTYDPPGVYRAPCDYASPAQVQALNWFNKMAHRYAWGEQDHITLSGHSKGGNKAQFIAIHSDLADVCYSFDGQGFSPEALACFSKMQAFEKRRKKIYSLSSDNDFVNVLGYRLMPPQNIFFFEAPMGEKNAVHYHLPQAILDERGHLRPQSVQGRLSLAAESLSNEVMALPPRRRRYITEGIMHLFQHHIDNEKDDILEELKRLLQ